MVRFTSASQAILLAVLGNIDQMLSTDLFAITECTGWCLSSFTRLWPMQSSAKSASRNGAGRGNWS
jgi:hypothetical protein